MDVTIYKSPKKVDLYLYVPASEDVEGIPSALLQQFGQPIRVMELTLTAERTLARADVVEVMRCISEVGYYLQVPPAVTDLAI